MTVVHIQIGPEVMRFKSFDEWCDTAQARFAECDLLRGEYICIDSISRVCTKGTEFMRARDESTFPIVVYDALLRRDTSTDNAEETD